MSSGEAVVPEPAPLDQARWIALWTRIGARQNGLQAFEQLATAYAEPARAYHTAAHIRDCLTELDWSRGVAFHPDEVEVALWFHDAVYVPGASDNEVQSAHLARSVLEGGGVPADIRKRVGELVLATQHVTVPRDPDAQHLCDIDLAILGRETGEFDEFERRIRQEYAWVPEPAYRHSRAVVLSGFLRRRSIYLTREFANRYEARARQNLERALAALSDGALPDFSGPPPPRR